MTRRPDIAASEAEPQARSDDAGGDELPALSRDALIAQLRLLREALPHAVYVCDVKTLTLTYLNRHVGLDLGYSRDELEAMGGLPLPIMHPEDARRLPELFARWQGPGPEGVIEAEVRLRARDGTWRWFQTRDAVLDRDAEGHVARIIGTTNDITERKTHERQNLSALRLDAMGHVAGHLAHEYNNLLATLQGQLAMARDVVWEPDQVRRLLDDAQNTVERAAALTRRLLGFAHQQVARSEQIDLEDLLNEAAPLLRSLFHLKRITFDLTACPPVVANRTQLLELLVQLVNSVSPGATSVVIHCGASAPSSGARSGPHPWALLRIEEHLAPEPGGVGPAEIAPTPLLGYGVDVARQLVANFKAQIEIAELGLRCCKLEIRFPPARVEHRTPVDVPVVPATSEGEAPGPQQLLVVEDDAVLLELTRRILVKAGFSVIAVGSGEEARAAWESAQEGILGLVTDVVMPGMSGLDLASRLLKERPELPVVFVSGFLKDDLKRDARLFQSRAIAVCDKPFKPEELVATVREVLGSAAASR